MPAIHGSICALLHDDFCCDPDLLAHLHVPAYRFQPLFDDLGEYPEVQQLTDERKHQSHVRRERTKDQSGITNYFDSALGSLDFDCSHELVLFRERILLFCSPLQLRENVFWTDPNYHR